MSTNRPTGKKRRYGMVIDLDRCTGCGACMVACASENNVPPAPEGVTARKGITPIRVFAVQDGLPERAYIPVMCMQCEHETPCAAVCPQQAVELDALTGIVEQMPQRCLGCRYCMTACPYHARYFNWRDPEWPAGMEQTLNPHAAPRMRGVVEKCDFCQGRLHAAEEKAAAAGRRAPEAGEYTPACVEACPTSAIVFGDLNDPSSEVARAAAQPDTFRWLERLGTSPKVHYQSSRPWVRRLAREGGTSTSREANRG